MSGRKKHRTANEYLQYLRGELSNQERHSLEKSLEADPFEKAAMEGFESITPDQVEDDLLSLHSRIRKRLSKRRRVAIYSVAATVASLLIVGTVFLQIHNFNPGVSEKQYIPEESHPAPPAQQIEQEEVDQVAEPQGSAMAAPAPEAELQKAEPITYMEAQPAVKGVESQADEVVAEPDSESRQEKRATRRKETMVPPVSERPDEIPQVSINEEELAQQISGTVSGIVISAEDQQPIPGANIVIRGLSSGTVSDLDGRFNLPADEDSNTTLVASYIGMETQEYQVGDQNEVELIMQPAANSLDEIIVVASGTEDNKMKESAFTAAEPTIGFKDFKLYIEENIQFPLEDTINQKAVVVIKFKVGGTGEISEIMTLRSPGELFTDEAIRLLTEGPSWNPARNENGPIDDWIRMRIVFKK